MSAISFEILKTYLYTFQGMVNSNHNKIRILEVVTLSASITCISVDNRPFANHRIECQKMFH